MVIHTEEKHMRICMVIKRKMKKKRDDSMVSSPSSSEEAGTEMEEIPTTGNPDAMAIAADDVSESESSLDNDHENPRSPKSPRVAPPPSHEDLLKFWKAHRSHQEGGSQEYPEEARATDEDKIWCNRQFADAAAEVAADSSSGLVVFLESPAMFTTKMLCDPPYNLPKSRMRCPQVDREAFQKMREEDHVSHQKLHDFLLGCSEGSIGAIWMDYCCTFDGNASTNIYPREDIRVVVENKLIRPGGFLFLTVSLRAYDSAEKIALGMNLSRILGKPIITKTYANMYFAGFRV
jgi:hypothetical protein